MTNTSALLVLMHLSDSGLPIGRFAHSYGIEPLAMAGLLEDAEALGEYLATSLRDCVAPLDGVAVCWSHRHFLERDLASLHALDKLVTCRKLSASTRVASESCGRELLRLLAGIPLSHEFTSFAERINDGESAGNISVVVGAASAAVGLDVRECVLMEMRSAASGMLSAAVRLGIISALRAQNMLWRLGGSIEEAVEIALSMDSESMATWFPEADLYYLRHKHATGRNFGS